MNILFASAEAYPFVKTGGLGDVAGALPRELSAPPFNHCVRLLLPAYRGLSDRFDSVERLGGLGNPFGSGEITLLLATKKDSRVACFLLQCDELFDRSGGPYLDASGIDHKDNAERFTVLSWCAAVIAQYGGLFGWSVDLVHCHDWQTGLTGAYLHAWGLRHPPVVFTIHNLQFAGAFEREDYAATGLPQSMYDMHGLEYYGRYSMLKAGIVYSHFVTTVSPSYAHEIQTPAFGCGLGGLLENSRHKLHGILNGVDYAQWDPSADTALYTTYTSTTLDHKSDCKSALQSALGLDTKSDAPLFGVVSRLSEQKGLDILLDTLPVLLKAGAQLCLLGSGDPVLEKAFLAAAGKYPGQIAVTIGYDESLSHRIQGGCDFLCVPSRFEPCGLTQLYALRYGTLPIVRRTGGLADTVTETPADSQTGFVFEQPSTADLGGALQRALDCYTDSNRMQLLRRRAMTQDFSWRLAAESYDRLYQVAIARA